MKELLSPAGNMECLKAAIHNGADAIYLGGKSFGARAFAGNFTNEELKEAVNYAHLYGVKIYVTANTIIYNNEIIYKISISNRCGCFNNARYRYDIISKKNIS